MSCRKEIVNFMKLPDDQSFINCANDNCAWTSIFNCAIAIEFASKMFTPRFATSIGSAGASHRASQCLRQQRVQATRSSRPATTNSAPCRTQQQRWQSTRGAQPKVNRSKGSFTRNAKILFRAHPYSMTGATIA